jgi:hypothetical protein
MLWKGFINSGQSLRGFLAATPTGEINFLLS